MNRGRPKGEPPRPPWQSKEPPSVNYNSLFDGFDREIIGFVTEDVRLSTLQKKLAKETSATVGLALALQISESMMYPENRSYVKRSADIIRDAIVDVFNGKFQQDIKDESANALGRVGFVFAETQDLEAFLAWLWQGLKRAKKEKVQALFLKSLAALMKLRPNLGDAEVNSITTDIQDILERTESSDIMRAAVENLSEISKWKPPIFEVHFQNVVDILVGWHIDSSQTPEVRSFLSQILLSWHAFWVIDMEFSNSLLKQLMEDLETFFHDFQATKNNEERKKISAGIISLIQVFNTVLSCLRSRQNVVSFLPAESAQWCKIILENFVDILHQYFVEDIAIAGQHTVIMLMERIENLFSGQKELILRFLKENVRGFITMTYEGKLRTMQSFSKVFMQVDQTSQAEVAKIILSSEFVLLETITSRNEGVKAAGVNLYRMFLSSKSISILQDVYNNLLELYEECMVRMANIERFTTSKKYSESRFLPSDLELIFFFVMAALRNIFVGKGSVLSQWALDPPPFSLLAKKSAIVVDEFISDHPWIHLCIIETLHRVCSMQGCFMSTSSLLGLNNQVSPSANHFQDVLNITTELLKKENLMEGAVNVILKWSEEILHMVFQNGYEEQLKEREPYIGFLNAIVDKVSKSKQQNALLRMMILLEKIVVNLKGKILSKISDICKYYLNCPNHKIQTKALIVLMKMAPYATLEVCSDRKNVMQKQYKNIVGTCFQQVLSSSVIHASDFKIFIEFILKSPTYGSLNSLESKLESSLQKITFRDLQQREILLQCQTRFDLRSMWIGMCVAHFCVNSKLRSPLGKPQDTLTTIEKMIRVVLQNIQDKKPVHLKYCHGLLIFYECLEKLLVNAFDGSAVVLLPPTKIVANFFHANKLTCMEWLSRLRAIVVQLAFAIGNYESAIRHGFAFLSKANKNGNFDQIDANTLSICILAIVISLARIGDRKNIRGLYNWCRNKGIKNLRWVKSLTSDPYTGAETVIDSLQRVMNSETEVSDIVQENLLNELCHGYMSVSDYESYEKALQSFRNGHRNSSTSEEILASMRDTCFKALNEFNSGVVPIKMKDWVEDNKNFGLVSNDDAIYRGHLMLLKTAACFQNGSKKLPSWADGDQLKRSLKESEKYIRMLLTDYNLASQQKKMAYILNVILNQLTNVLDNRPSNLESLFSLDFSAHSSSELIVLKKWGDFFSKYRRSSPVLHFQLKSLDLQIAKVSRKEKNLRLASFHIQKALFDGAVTGHKGDLIEFMKNINFRSVPLSVDKASCLRQGAKLAYLRDEKVCAVMTLCGIICSIGNIAFSCPESSEVELLEVSSRALHNLAHWLINDKDLLDNVYPDVLSSNAVTVAQVLEYEQAMAGVLDFLPPLDIANDRDFVVGRILRMAVLQSPNLAKTWNSFAEWAYELGERAVETSEKEGIQLTFEERNAVFQNLAFASESEVEEVLKLFQKNLIGIGTDSDVNGIEIRRNSLFGCQVIHRCSEEQIGNLLLIWINIQRRLFFYYEWAIYASFQFISLSSGTNEEQLTAATLKILQLTVKYASELQETLRSGLETTESSKWKVIIPQLFSRLNHPVKAVRDRISDLLCRLAKDYPHLIVFPAVVGSSTSRSNAFSKILTSLPEEKPISEEELEKSNNKSMEAQEDPNLLNAYNQIVEFMRKEKSERVEQVQRFVSELQRISVLWDELWLGTLHQLNQDVSKRVKKMEEEAKRLSQNRTLTDKEKKHLLAEKYNIIFKPVLYVLERVVSLTSKPPETPYEVAFAKQHDSFIKSMMEELRSPSNAAKPMAAWRLLQHFQSNLESQLLNRTSLKFSDISPAIASMKKGAIPMPGLTEDALTVEQIDDHLTILLTKTKPKRVTLKGNDGKRYMYLFKGLEDLHLDERIMQFLSVANTMMRKQGNQYRARHYSVIPLGPRSGLIQWVGGAIPLYSLFKKWQNRQALPTVEKAVDRKGIAFQKPSEVFYNKVIPLLRENGFTNLENRKSWPLSILKKVMQELLEETPENILSQEAWFASSDPQDWYRFIQNITISFAVMSVIGYIIGLGDRHLDNLLLDLKDGEIIHIDYNVCFEKGKNLRIPERVPCRLSQNIQDLFGLPGVDGLFKDACEVTLEALRKGKDTLMTLLEAFLYDPLVDWTPDVELGVAGAYQGGVGHNDTGVKNRDKRDMQAEITFSMFVVRVAEMKGPWLENKKDLKNLLDEMEEKVATWLDVCSSKEDITTQLSNLHQAMAILKEAEVTPNHRLFGLHGKYIEIKLVEGAIQEAQDKISNFVEEQERQLHLYQRAVSALGTNQINKWSTEIIEISTGSTSTVVIKDFLEKAGQSQLLEQFAMVEGKFCSHMMTLRQSLLQTIHGLNQYSNVVSLLPNSIKQQHRRFKYLKWSKMLSENLSVDMCEEVLQNFTKEFLEVDESALKRKWHVLNLIYHLENEAQEMQSQIKKIFGKRSVFGVEDQNTVNKMVNEETLKFKKVVNNVETPNALDELMFSSLAHFGKELATLEFLAFDNRSNLVKSAVDFSDVTVVDEIFLKVGHISQWLTFMEEFGVIKKENEYAKMFSKIRDVYKQIDHFRNSFYNIIALEGLKVFQKEDSSASSALELFSDHFKVPDSVDDIVDDLEKAVFNQEFEITEECKQKLNSAKILKKKYEALIKDMSVKKDNDSLSPGQMLILALDTVFRSANATVKEAVKILTTLEVQPRVMDVDIVKEVAPVFGITLNENLAELSECLTFLKQFKFFKDFFQMCASWTSALKVEGNAIGKLPPSGLQLARPVELFLVDFMTQRLLGLASFGLSILIYNKFGQGLTGIEEDRTINLAKITTVTLKNLKSPSEKNTIGCLVTELENFSRVIYRAELAKRFEENLEALQSMLHINHMQENVIQWTNEGHLSYEPVNLIPPLRISVVAELEVNVATMIAKQKDIVETLNKYKELQAGIEQRLKWASGANPEVQEIFDSFSSSILSQVNAFKAITGLVKSVVAFVNSILQHETLNSHGQESTSADAAFMALLSHCQHNITLKDAHVHDLSDQDLAVFELNPPGETINPDWIKDTEKVILSKVQEAHKELTSFHSLSEDATSAIQGVGAKIRNSISKHQKLMSDTGALLRTISKSEDYEVPEVQSYLKKYMEFSNITSSLIRVASGDEKKSEEHVHKLSSLVEEIKEKLDAIYDEVMGFSALFKEENLEKFKVKPPEEIGQGDPDQSKASKELTHATEEEKNAFALNVLRRIRHKLDGREPDALKKASVQEQVEFIIREATSIDNLSLMYEGWTAWI